MIFSLKKKTLIENFQYKLGLEQKALKVKMFSNLTKNIMSVLFLGLIA